MRLSNLPLWSEQAARAGAIALGFSIPISVALDNALLALVLLFWLASGNYGAKLAHIKATRVALAACALFALLVIGLAYGTRGPGDGLHYLGKYMDLAFVPVFATLFAAERTRRCAWYAFAAALALTLALSYLARFGIVQGGTWFGALEMDPSMAVFKLSLTQNILLAFGAFLYYCLGRSAQTARARYAWWALAALAALNVLLIGQGRTGHLVLCALALYGAYARWRWRGALAVLVAAVLAGSALMMVPSTLGKRVTVGLSEMRDWRPGVAAHASVGERLEFYSNSLAIVSEHPWFGTGTGSFPKVYAERVAGTLMEQTVNPHNEYLHIAIQLGVAGLALLLYLFYCQWRLAPRLASQHESELARGLVITFALGCLFNSLLLDHVEGLLYAWASGLLYAQFTGHPKAQPA